MKRKSLMLVALSIFFNLFIPLPLLGGSPPQMTLAMVYEEGIDVSQYMVSEKLDGIRAFWDGKDLISRQGNIFSAPAWFTKGFPDQALDGELWMDRNTFEKISGAVSKQIPVESEWRRIMFMVFEMPLDHTTFAERYSIFTQLILESGSPFLKAIRQFKVESREKLQQILNQVIAKGGEGLMLHRAKSPYQVGRTRDLLKLKPYFDDEAKVLFHLPGKGKYKGKMGSICVEMGDGTVFRIGTGFTDYDRDNPPPVGSIITFKYHGRTKKKIPKFASFLRIRSMPF